MTSTCDAQRDDLEAAKVRLQSEAAVRQRMMRAAERMKADHGDDIMEVVKKHACEIQKLKQQIHEGHNLRSMLERERGRIQDLQQQNADLEATVADLKDRQKGLKQGHTIRTDIAHYERISAQLPELKEQKQIEETKLKNLRAQASDVEDFRKNLEVVVVDLEKKVGTLEKKLGKARVLLEQEAIQSMKSDQECFICRCGDTDAMSISCTGCTKRACLSCAERGTMQSLSASSSIKDRTRATQLCCLDTKCRGHLPSNIQVLFSDTTSQALTQARLELSTMTERIEKEKIDTVKLHELSMSSPQAKALHLERQIVQNMMDLRCPSCAAPFESFEGCCALTCSRCQCQFCSWCLEESPNWDSNHSHVARCNMKPKNLPDALFVDQKVWRAFVNGRAKRNVTSYIDKLDDSVKCELHAWVQPLLN